MQPDPEKQFAVYIMGNARPTLYTGVTNNLPRRVSEHKEGKGSVFTSKYKLTKLLYYEVAEAPMQAIIREKQIKNLNRAEKLALIASTNPAFADLTHEIWK